MRSEAHVNVGLDLTLVAEHLKVHLVLLIQPRHVLPADLREIFACEDVTGSSSTTSRSAMDPGLLLPLLVDDCEAVPVLPQVGEVQPAEQPVSVLLQGLQLEHGGVADVAGDADLEIGINTKKELM